MELNLKFFGKLAEISGSSTLKFKVDKGLTIKELEQLMAQKYDSWSNQTYQIAVNQEITSEKELGHLDEIAFLPPFAGG